ncbi:MAG: amino acid ABC transporter substrate-binding protein, partial [Proteobacteria bacterium]|nr:amino acid ABC transporter substrate-binding protein [Pseudomonadota bacterium]
MSIVVRVLAAAISLFVVALGLATEAESAPISILDAVKARGKVVCGVQDHAPGFSEVSP